MIDALLPDPVCHCEAASLGGRGNPEIIKLSPAVLAIKDSLRAAWEPDRSATRRKVLSGSFDFLSVESKFKKEKAYTLVEMLIVLVIISIVMSSAVLTVHVNQKKEFETTANQIKQWILLAEEEALLRPAVLGVQVMPNAIQFLNYHEDTDGFDVMNETIFRLHRFSNDVQLTLKTNNPLIISSNGDLSPFTLYIGKRNASPTYKMIGEENGNITIDPIQ